MICKTSTTSRLPDLGDSKVDQSMQLLGEAILLQNCIKSCDVLPSLELGLPKRKVVFQPSIFRCYVSFRGCSIVSKHEPAVWVKLGEKIWLKPLDQCQRKLFVGLFQREDS